MKVHINTWRDGGWWVATSKDIEGFATQARRLDQIPALAYDIALLADDVDDPDACEFVIHVSQDIEARASHARELAEAARLAQDSASKAMREAARAFAQQGLTVRDIGELLGVSYQRAQKLAAA